MSTAGPLSYGTPTDNAAVGSVAWNFVTNPKVGLTVGATSHWLVTDHYGFAIPTGSLIQGIQFDLTRGINLSTTAHDSAIRVVKGGVIGSTDHADTSTAYTLTGTNQTYGGPTELWGLSWTAADINAATFGLAQSVTIASGSSATIRLPNGPSSATITVYYLPPAPSIAYPTSVSGGRVSTATISARHTTSVALTSSTPAPQTLPASNVWLRADRLNLANSATLSGWPDSSGNGRTATTTVAGLSNPTFRTNALNGLPCVRFTASGSQGLRISSTGVNLPYTIIYVGRLFGGADQRLVGSVYDEGSNFVIGFHGGQEDRFFAGGFVYDPGHAATTNWKLYGATGDGSTAQFYSSGNLLANNSIGVLGPNGYLALSGYGLVNNPPSSELCNGEITELFMFNSVLSTGNRQLVEGYLAWKYGFVSLLPGGHPWKLVNPVLPSVAIPAGAAITDRHVTGAAFSRASTATGGRVTTATITNRPTTAVTLGN